jgi:hypothetical protein
MSTVVVDAANLVLVVQELPPQIVEVVAQGPQGATIYPGAGLAVSTGSAWGASKAVPAGDVVGTTDVQAISNKSISGGSINGAPIGASSASTGSFTVLTEAGLPVVTQSDVGTSPNQVPLNQYLGGLAYLDVAATTAPASASSVGSVGQIAFDADYIYVCVAVNTWKRAAIATW